MACCQIRYPNNYWHQSKIFFSRINHSLFCLSKLTRGRSVCFVVEKVHGEYGWKVFLEAQTFAVFRETTCTATPLVFGEWWMFALAFCHVTVNNESPHMHDGMLNQMPRLKYIKLPNAPFTFSNGQSCTNNCTVSKWPPLQGVMWVTTNSYACSLAGLRHPDQTLSN